MRPNSAVLQFAPKTSKKHSASIQQQHQNKPLYNKQVPQTNQASGCQLKCNYQSVKSRKLSQQAKDNGDDLFGDFRIHNSAQLVRNTGRPVTSVGWRRPSPEKQANPLNDFAKFMTRPASCKLSAPFDQHQTFHSVQNQFQSLSPLSVFQIKARSKSKDRNLGKACQNQGEHLPVCDSQHALIRRLRFDQEPGLLARQVQDVEYRRDRAAFKNWMDQQGRHDKTLKQLLSKMSATPQKVAAKASQQLQTMAQSLTKFQKYKHNDTRRNTICPPAPAYGSHSGHLQNNSETPFNRTNSKNAKIQNISGAFINRQPQIPGPGRKSRKTSEVPVQGWEQVVEFDTEEIVDYTTLIVNRKHHLKNHLKRK